jgi:hypothetical protein
MTEIWIAATVTTVGAGLSAMDAKKQADKDSKANKLATEQGFNRERWLQEQGRKWQLEDRQRGEKRIKNFRGFAPDSARNYNGVAVIAPEETSTEGLADFDPNQTGLLAKPQDPLMKTGGASKEKKSIASKLFDPGGIF